MRKSLFITNPTDGTWRELLSAKEACGYLAITPKALRAEAIPFSYKGGKRFYKKAHLIDWLSSDDGKYIAF